MILTIFAALAKFERDLITSRISEGRAAKVEKGLILGPKPALTGVKAAKIRREYGDGATDHQLAKEWEVSRSTIHRVLGIYGKTKPYVTPRRVGSRQEEGGQVMETWTPATLKKAMTSFQRSSTSPGQSAAQLPPNAHVPHRAWACLALPLTAASCSHRR